MTPSDITSLSEGAFSAVVQPFLFSYSEASKWQLNIHAFIYFTGPRTPQGGGSPLTQSSAALPFILTHQAADACFPRVLCCQESYKKLRSSFPSETSFSLGHPIILTQQSNNWDCALLESEEFERSSTRFTHRLSRGRSPGKAEMEPVWHPHLPALCADFGWVRSLLSHHTGIMMFTVWRRGPWGGRLTQ